MKKIILVLCLCFILISCNKAKTPEESINSDEPIDEVTPTVSEEKTEYEEIYVPTNTTLSFSDNNMDKVITEPTFDINNYTNDAGSDIKPYQLFSNGMCLQRDAINRIWGKASQTKNIAIEFKGKVYYGSVNGREWEVYLPKMNAGGPYELTIISEKGRFKLTDVYIGEVFLCSGQSNMEFRAQDAGNVLKDLYSTSNCINDNIRMLNLPSYPQEEATSELINTLKWESANQKTIPGFSAVGYLFGKQMQEELGCPVGLISAAVGGTSIEFWLSQENVNKLPYQPFIDQSNEYNKLVMTPSLGYNGMLYPLIGLNVRGVVWYQGESNALGTQNHYDKALNIYIEQCREMFNNKQLAFTICELARYEGNTYTYSVVNEKINEVAETDPYIVVARNLDLGEWKDIHPKDKRELARRASYETLRVFYKKDYVAPINLKSYTFNDDGTVTIILTADAVLKNGSNGFEVYVNNKFTYDCNVTIEGNKVTVSASGEIIKVRYGYTCEMTEEIKADVSKMVTVYDNNGFPLDLFIISK